MPKDPISEQTAPTQEMAEQVAKAMGCEGAHKVGDSWAPCESHAAMMILIRQGKDGYERWRDKQQKPKGKPNRIILQPGLEAELGKRTRRFEPMTERTRGIDTLPGGGLVNKSLRDAFGDAIKAPERHQNFPTY